MRQSLDGLNAARFSSAVGKASRHRSAHSSAALILDLAADLLRDPDVDRAVASVCRVCEEALGIRCRVVLDHGPAERALPAPSHAAADGTPAGGVVIVPGRGGASLGVLQVDQPGAHELDRDEESFLAALATVLGAAVERSRVDAELRADHAVKAALAGHWQVMMGELQHRVRNDLHVLHGFALAQTRRATDSSSAAALEAVGQRVLSLAALYGHLLGDGKEGRLDLGAYLRELCARIEAAEDLAGRGIVLQAELGELPLALDAAVGLGIAVKELVANAAEHAFGEGGGRVTVRLIPGPSDGGATLLVADDGRGFASMPVDTSGLNFVRRLVGQAGGRIERLDASGTTWCIRLG